MNYVLNSTTNYREEIVQNGKYYIAPLISTGVYTSLCKSFDLKLPKDSVLAFFDTSMLGNSGCGLVFTDDFFCFKENSFSETMKIFYKDILNAQCYGIPFGDDSKLALKIDSADGPTLICDVKCSNSINNQSLFKLLAEIKSCTANDSIKGEIVNECSCISDNETEKIVNLPTQQTGRNTIVAQSDIANTGTGSGNNNIAPAVYSQTPATKEVSEINTQIAQTHTPASDENELPKSVRCPNCNASSDKISSKKKGMSFGKAAVGMVATGHLLGAAAGFIGSNNVICKCSKCGFEWDLQKELKKQQKKRKRRNRILRIFLLYPFLIYIIYGLGQYISAIGSS